jgi:hypothetical protein
MALGYLSVKQPVNTLTTMFYINYRYNSKIETIDSFETEEEAQAMLVEYQLVGGGGVYYLSLVELDEQVDTESGGK